MINYTGADSYERSRIAKQNTRRKVQEQKARDERIRRAGEREFSAVRLEMKSMGQRTGSGVAMVYNIVDGQGDLTLPGALTKTLAWWSRQKSNLPLRDNHNMRAAGIIGEVTRMREVPEGLFIDFELIPGPAGEALSQQIKAGLLSGLSIGYYAVKTRDPSWEERELGALRVLVEVELTEISLVSTPAVAAARVHAMKRAGALREQADFLDEIIEVTARDGWALAAARLTPEEEDYLLPLVQQRLEELGVWSL
jgi:HK97 family phage prohead protease